MEKGCKSFSSSKRQRRLLPANYQCLVTPGCNFQTISFVPSGYQDAVVVKSKQCSFSHSNENHYNSFSTSAQPNILKRSDVSIHKDSSAGPLVASPVKSLSFSPSRFLNVTKDVGVNKSEHDISKDLSFSHSSHNVEDSGIGSSDIDTTLPFPSFSSTPKSKTRCMLHQCIRAKSPSKDDALRFNAHLIQSTPKVTNRDENKSPTIQKYIDESVLQTPTPFKCSCDNQDIKAENLLISNIKHEENLLFVNDKFFKKPSPIPYKQNRILNSGRKKTARKALVLDHHKIDRKKSLPRPSKQMGFLKVSNCQIKRLLFDDKSYDHSSLTEKTTVVEKRKITPIKSVYYTRKRKAEAVLNNLSTQWVSVACGKSSDQRDMIAAAKRCLYRS